MKNLRVLTPVFWSAKARRVKIGEIIEVDDSFKLAKNSRFFEVVGEEKQEEQPVEAKKDGRRKRASDEEVI